MKNILLILVLLIVVSVYADKKPITERDYTNTNIEMADQLRAEGKIYVLVAIILVIFVGVIGYLVFLDKKLTKVEQSRQQQLEFDKQLK